MPQEQTVYSFRIRAREVATLLFTPILFGLFYLTNEIGEFPEEKVHKEQSVIVKEKQKLT